MAAAQWSHQGQKAHDEESMNMQGPYSEEEIERLAEYSVRVRFILSGLFPVNDSPSTELVAENSSTT